MVTVCTLNWEWDRKTTIQHLAFSIIKSIGTKFEQRADGDAHLTRTHAHTRHAHKVNTLSGFTIAQASNVK